MDAADAVRLADVARARAEEQVNLAKLVEEARDAGYKKCEENFEHMQEMMKKWKE